MASVTYKNQPAINATKGSVPLAGTKYVYEVSKVLWPSEIRDFLKTLFIGKTCHVCCGLSELGDVLVDINPDMTPDVIADANDLPFEDHSFDTVLCDPPYNGDFQWNHDMLCELSRVASKRIIFQHWFLPVTPDGGWKKWKEAWELRQVYVWQPRTYFGRVQVISVLDAIVDFKN